VINLPFHHRLRRLVFDMHLPDLTIPGQSGGHLRELGDVATRFDPEALLELFVHARVNSVLFWAKCQYGNFYYDTALGHKHSGLGELDLLGRVLDLAHQRDMVVLAYYSNVWDVSVARVHPEWMMRDAEGNASYERWPRVCLNTPYRELVQAHLRELLSRYAVDGLWMDMLHVLPCYCPQCEAQYRERFGRPMPRHKEGRAWLDLVHFQYEVLGEYIGQARTLVKSLRPDAVFMFNYFGSPYAPPSNGLDATGLLCLSDCGTTEGYTEWHGVQFPSYAARLMRAATHDRPYEVLTSRFIRTWDFTIRPLEQMKFEAFSVVANGGAVGLDDSPYHDGRAEPEVYRRLAEVYSEIEAREPWLLNSEPLYYAGLYHSLKTREVAEMFGEATHDGEGGGFYGFYPEQLEAPADVVLSTQGAFKVMIEGHLPTQFIYDQGLTAEELGRFRVIYMPNVAAVSEDEAELLRMYVKEGGGLVATGATSLYDEWGEQRQNFLLADILGVDFVRRGPFSFNYLQPLPGALGNELGDAPLAHYRPMQEVHLNRLADVVATLTEPIVETGGEVYYHNNQPAPYRRTDVPAVAMSQVGQGRVVYISGEPELNYAVLGHAPYRRLIVRALTWAAGERPGIVPHAPLNTEVAFRRLNGNVILHFLTCWLQKGVAFQARRTAESIEETFPVYDVRVDVPRTVCSAVLVPAGQRLAVQREGERAWVTLPQIRLWETLVLEM
jgi:hypothetical protein